MGQKITTKPEDVWKMYLDGGHDFKNYYHEIAKNDEYGVIVYLSEDSKGAAAIYVEADGVMVYSENVNNANCEKTVTDIYDKYLTSRAIETLSDMSETDSAILNEEDAIAEREEELDTLVYDFVMSVLGEDVYFDEKKYDVDNMFEDIKDHFLEYLARKYELQIYRPMFLEDEDGKESFENYPYECMEFEDEDNPIYKK